MQQAVAGPLVMVQSVFCRGELVASHACQRVREGASGGASHKVGLDLPEAREHLARLGAALGWHGALSADVILSPAGIQFIDINPRLVEPVNALDSGVDLVRALVEVARSGTSRPQPPARPGRERGRTSCCWRSWGRPSTAGAAASRASCGTGCCTAGTTGAATKS